MTKGDVEMVEQIDEWLSLQYSQTSSPRRNKRFGLATWVLVGDYIGPIAPLNILRIISGPCRNKIYYNRIKLLN